MTRNRFMIWTTDKLFELMIDRHASDLVFVPGAAPALWISGAMRQLDSQTLTNDDIGQLFLPLLNDGQKRQLTATGDVDFSVGKNGHGRLRINLHRQQGCWGAAIRLVPAEPPEFDDLKLPARLLNLGDLNRGLVLVTGTAGSGKSTTLAALIQYMNSRHAYHIITLEDPTEFTFTNQTAVIEQREIGVDSSSFASALRHVVRQRPDVILVGEMRDLETIAAALTAAEMGHLVIATLHTIDAVQTVGRIIDVFPAAQQAQVRVQLAATLQGVVCQTLFADEKNGGMIPAVELMLSTPAVRRAIRENETHLLGGMIETGKSFGMQTMDAAIAELVRAGHISSETALARAHNPERLSRLLAA